MQQIVQIPLQIFSRAAKTGGADNHPHLGGNSQLAHDFAQLGPFIAFNATGDASGTRVVGHQYQVATGQTDQRGQGCALVAALFLIDLYDDLSAFLDDIFDVGTTASVTGEVFTGDLFQGQKAVPVGAKVNKSGLKAGFNAGYFGPVDVGFLLFTGSGFNIQIEQALAIDECNPQLFLLGCIDQHSLHRVPIC